MKLNQKGYMLVEIVVASVLAMSIAYFLLNLTYKFKNKNEDIQQSYIYTKDKVLITKNIMSDLERGVVKNIAVIANQVTFELDIINNNASEENITEKRKLLIEDNIIEYGKIDNDNFDMNDISYYKKELSSSLIIKNLNCEHNNNNMIITISISSIYDDNDYSIKLIAKTS